MLLNPLNFYGEVNRIVFMSFAGRLSLMSLTVMDKNFKLSRAFLNIGSSSNESPRFGVNRYLP